MIKQSKKAFARGSTIGRMRAIAIGAIAAVAAALFSPSTAWAIPTVHEITAQWAGDPAPSDAPYGVTRTAEFRVNTNDATDPYSNQPVENVRVTLTAANGAFSSIPAVCQTVDVDPVSAITANGTQLLCNLGTVEEGTSTIVQAPLKANGAIGSQLSVSGSVTSDSAVAPAGPAATAPLPISGTRGMDLIISAPNEHYQQQLVPSRFGGNRQSIVVDYGISMTAGSIPGPATYSFGLNLAVTVAGQLPGLQWEGCGVVDDTAQATGIPYSEPSRADRTNAPGCSITGSGTAYTVTLTGLDYSLQHVPTRDSLGNVIPSTTNFIAAGKLVFSYTAPITQSTGVTFTATPTPFTFVDGVSQAESNPANNSSGTTVILPGSFAIHWTGGPAAGRSPWDANLWAAPGTAQALPLPVPGAGTSTDPEPFLNSQLPLASNADSTSWTTYSGPGGADLAGLCSMVQNPAAFRPAYADFVAYNGAAVSNIESAHIWYRTDAIDTKTETCGQPVGVAGSPWTAVPLSPECAATSEYISPAYADAPCLVTLPAGVTAVKMTWNPAVDTEAHHMLRVWGYVPESAPVGAESWTVGAFNASYDTSDVFGAQWPNLNNWINISTNPGVYANIPGSTYGPNTNGQRDAMRIQGPNGVITKSTPATSAQPGVPVTYSLTAEAQLAIQSPPAQSFTVTDTLPAGMLYVAGSGTPTPVVSSNGSGQQVLTFTFTNVPANTPQPISYQAQIPAGTSVAPGTVLTNVAQIDVPGDSRYPAARQATASVVVPSDASTTIGKSTDDGVLSFFGDDSTWTITINSQDPAPSAFTDTIDILPALGDGRGTTIDGEYTVTGVTAPAGSTVYYTTAATGALSNDPRHPSNGGTPGSVGGNTVGWSTTPVAQPTAIRVIGPALDPGAAQTIAIAFETPAATDCVAPAPDDNKPGQLLVNSATTIASHTGLPMRSSASSVIGDCYAVDLQKFVLRPGGDPTVETDWIDADTTAEYQQYAEGDDVPYRIVVINKGTGALTDLTVTDDLLPECSFTIASLAGGASSVEECTGTAAVGTTVNTATVSVVPPEGEDLEVSDPAGIVVPEPYLVSKTSSPAAGAAVPVGGVISYTITVTEPASSAAPFPGASLVDDLSDVLDDASYNGDLLVSAGTAELDEGAERLEWSIDALVPGQVVTITYSVTVEAVGAGDQIVANTVVTPPGAANCDEGSTDPACGTILFVPSYTVSKGVDVDEAFAGDIVTYTLTVTNTGPVAYPANGAGAASLTDSLTSVLDDATIVPGSATADAGTVTVGADSIAWTGPLAVAPAAGSVVTIQYQVLVDPTASSDHRMVNFVVPTGPNGECADDDACTTITLIGEYEVTKTSTPAVAYPGDTVSYTITVTNTGEVDYDDATPASLTDDLSDVLDDGSYVSGSVAATAGTPVVDVGAGTLTWNGPLPVGGDPVTISYDVEVADAPAGDILLVNAVTPTGEGGECVTCATTTPIRMFEVVKSADVAMAQQGQTVTYTITVTNVGTADYPASAPASFTDDLSAVLDDATYNADATASAGTVTFEGHLLSWSGSLPLVGPAVTIEYSVTVDSPVRGDFALENTVVTPPGIGGNCLAGSGDPDCTVEVPIRAFHVEKTVDATDVIPGDVVTYTIVVENIGQVAYDAGSPASFTDDLSQVLDDAAYDGNAAATSGTVSYAEPVLSWAGALATGATATVTYSVTVDDPDLGDQLLRNAVVTPSDANCAVGSTDPLCDTTVPGPQLHVVKSASTTITSPGDVVTYTITVENTGPVPFTVTEPASFTDDLSDVLDDADYNGDADNGAVYTAPTLSWSGPLAVGGVVTITYSVTVTGDGDDNIDNAVVTPPEVNGNCTAGSTDPDCFERVTIRSYQVEKTSDAGAESDFGQIVRYTIAVTNTGNEPYTDSTPAGVVDDLSDVLDDAAYNDDADQGATFVAPELAWSGPLAVGESIVISYSVTINDTRTGNQRVYNEIASTAVGGAFEANCVPGAIGAECWTLTQLPPPPLATTGLDALRWLAGAIAALLVGIAATTTWRRRGGLERRQA